MGKVIHGAIVKVLFEGTKIGVMTTITESEDYNVTPAYGIGQMTPFELVALRFTGNFNYTKLVLKSDTIAALQYAARAGKTVEAITKDILTQAGFTIVIEEKYTQNNIATITGCKMSNLSLTISENAITQQSGSGMYGAPMEMP